MPPTFGLFVPADPARDPVEAARHAEDLGFDLITVSDHLQGRSASLETWTVLTWMAAVTERIRVGPNVLGLPYRHPAVTAKMAGSLHELSGGRLVLGLGAGGNDAEFRAFGLTQREPGEKVEALEEALRIIRAMWAGDQVTFPGSHFEVTGATIEPRPDEPPPVWLGVYGERMLEVCGRLGDGWLPSRMYLEPEAAFRKLRTLREHAERAGRDPEDLTYAYNVWVKVDEEAEPRKGQIAGRPERVVEACAEFLEGGFTHLNFSASGDQVEQRERLAKEIVPPLREL